MYQGKFDSKNKQATVDVSELVAQRNSAPAKKPAPAREPVPVTSPIKEKHAKKVAEQEAPVRKAPAPAV